MRTNPLHLLVLPSSPDLFMALWHLLLFLLIGHHVLGDFNAMAHMDIVPRYSSRQMNKTFCIDRLKRKEKGWSLLAAYVHKLYQHMQTSTRYTNCLDVHTWDFELELKTTQCFLCRLGLKHIDICYAPCYICIKHRFAQHWISKNQCLIEQRARETRELERAR